MKEIPEYEKDIASIRSIMERSAKFISLSGLSGVLAGIYALSGALAAYYLIYYPYSPFGFRFYYVNEKEVIVKLLAIAFAVLAASLVTGYLLSLEKSKKLNAYIWNKASQQLLQDLLIPLVTGGLFIIILLSRGYFVIVASACLIFYGLALINGSRNTFKEVRYLGFTEIVLGLASALLPGYGLIFWAVGFGVMHILYGVLMHYRYDR
jgi:predicted lysophospholipase L1 biosynthesis ABC-type transport system permease subunit